MREPERRRAFTLLWRGREQIVSTRRRLVVNEKERTKFKETKKSSPRFTREQTVVVAADLLIRKQERAQEISGEERRKIRRRNNK